MTTCLATMTHEINTLTLIMNSFADIVRMTTDALNEMAQIVAEHREQWLCEGEGQWPDKFTLLNRYVRTDYEPPFIFNE